MLGRGKIVFIGRKPELAAITALTQKKTASLVVCKGRRRIGKSALAAEFGKTQKKFISFQGLSPRPGQTNQDQLDHFVEELVRQTNIPRMSVKTWTDAFDALAITLKNQRSLVLLDEISWMGAHDPDFAGRLKISWDVKLSRFSKLIVLVCGSVSSWIEENILNSADFVGRLSATIDLKELNLRESSQLMDPQSRMRATDKIKILSVTGGVPRYLEEVNSRLTAEQNIKMLCFEPQGFLLHEFDRIFNDIFDRRSKKYRAIIRLLLKGHLSTQEICAKLKVEQNGSISRYLTDIEHSGFIARDYSHILGSKTPAKLSRYRISDNYLRFYLRYIEPEKSKIAGKLYQNTHLGSLTQWNTIMGLQVENLILANLVDIVSALKLDPNMIVAAGPYFQTKSAKTKGACQIDLLIELKNGLAYACEVKFREKIGKSIVDEVKKKIEFLRKPRNFSVRPVLIYHGQLEDEDYFQDYFDALISIEDLF